MFVRLRIPFAELDRISGFVIVVACAEAEQLQLMRRERKHVDLDRSVSEVLKNLEIAYERQRIQGQVAVRDRWE